MTDTFDAIVLGAGAMGSAAAYYLSRRRQKVLLLEQFEIDHRRGSSYGYSRIIRYSYDYPEYVDLAKDTYPLWFALEDALGETLVVKTGGIDFGPATDETLIASIASAKLSGLEHELLDPKEAEQRFPQFQFNDDFQVLYQPDSGYVSASKAVLGHIKLAKRHGAVVMENAPVAEVSINGNGAIVKTENETYSAGTLVVTAGSWAKSLLRQTGIDLPLTPLRCQLNFVQTNGNADFEAENCPVWIARVRGLFPEALYGIPSHHGTGFKVAFHGGPPIDHPSQVDYTPDPENFAQAQAFMRAHIPTIADEPLKESRICLYTQTPDEHFIVDKHPAHDHVVIGAGFSGHGFKFSTIIGKMLSDIALDGATTHNDRLFKIDRFLE